MFNKIPIAIIEAITDVPPPDMNGSVIPVTGIRPIVIAIFSNTWKRNIPVNPIVISAPYKSSQSRIIFVSLMKRSEYSVIKARPPINPSSSPTTENIKSDC